MKVGAVSIIVYVFYFCPNELKRRNRPNFHLPAILKVAQVVGINKV